MNSKRKSVTGARPESLNDDEKSIQAGEDYRIWCRSNGEEVVIRSRKIYLQDQVQWAFEISEETLREMRKAGLKAPSIGVLRFPGSALIAFIDLQTEVACVKS